jgi:hypothetical protein
LKSKGVRSALILLVLEAAIGALVFGATSRHEAKGQRVEADQALGLVREGSSGEQKPGADARGAGRRDRDARTAPREW